MVNSEEKAAPAANSFCEYLGDMCTKCWENDLNVCHISLGEQDYYKGFKMYDQIMIVRRDGNVGVESDVEVKYKTKYPWGLQAGKGAEFATEYSRHEKKMRDYIAPRLPAGTHILNSHLHYFPDKRDPEIVAFHIHVHKRAHDLDEAKLVAQKIVNALNTAEIEEAIKES